VRKLTCRVFLDAIRFLDFPKQEQRVAALPLGVGIIRVRPLPRMALFYDNNTDQIAATGALQPVERVYAIRFSQFRDAEWKRLAQIYSTLPGWADRGKDVPYWFGLEESPPFLWASVEPSGLLVHGMLSPEAWEHWDSAFRQHLHEFPTFEV
jgi:hypothetical protein